MEKHQTFFTMVKILLMTTITVFFIIYIFQRDNIEQRISNVQTFQQENLEKKVIALQNNLIQIQKDNKKNNSDMQQIQAQLAALYSIARSEPRSVASTSEPKKVEVIRTETKPDTATQAKKEETQPVNTEKTTVTEPKKDLFTSTGQSKRVWLYPDVPNFLEPDPFEYGEQAVLEGKTDGTLRSRWGSDPKSFNVVLENDGQLARYLRDLCLDFAAFSHWNNPEKFMPRLAERIEVVDDYKTWVFYFRKGVKWHRPRVDWSDSKYTWLDKEHYVTAHDFKFYLDIVRNPDVQAGHMSHYYQEIKEYKLVDDYTLIVYWNKKQYQSIEAMTVMFFPVPRFIYQFYENGDPIPEEQVGKEFNNHWFNQNFVGCGPYELAEYTRSQSLKLVRNEDYWGNKPPLKEIVYLFYIDRVQVPLKMKSGEQDLADVIAPELLEAEQRKSNSPFATGEILVGKINIVGFTYIGWNAARPFFNDKRLRRAMTYALNRDGILKSVVRDLGAVVTGPWPYDSSAYDKNIKPYPYDLKEAERLLSECGWEDTDGDGIRDKMINGEKRQFRFSFLVWNTSPTWNSLAKVYKEDLYKIGIDMSIQSVEWAIMLKSMENKEFDAYSGYWSTSYLIDPYQTWHSSQADVPRGSNRVGFKNKRADEIIDISRSTFDAAERAKLLHELHAIIHEEQPYTFFYAPIDLAVWRKYVKNVQFRKEKPHVYPLPYYIDK